MNDLESKLVNLPLRRPSQNLDERVRAAKPGYSPTEQPRQQGFDPSQPNERKEEKMKTSMFARMSPVMKAAAAFLLAVVLVGSGWAAEKIYKNLIAETTVFIETSPPTTRTMPDGTKWFSGAGGSMTSVSSDDLNPTETYKRRKDDMNHLIAKKKYRLVKTFEYGESPLVRKGYSYEFTFSDGTHDRCNFSLPLEGVSSLDDMDRKVAEAGQREQDNVYNAVTSGKCRLLDVKVREIHLCRDVQSNHKIRVQRIAVGKDKSVALVTVDTAHKPFSQYQVGKTSSWEDHLKAIREGRRELLGTETMNRYFYETVLDDGSKFIFEWSCADSNGRPLKEPAKK